MRGVRWVRSSFLLAGSVGGGFSVFAWATRQGLGLGQRVHDDGLVHCRNAIFFLCVTLIMGHWKWRRRRDAGQGQGLERAEQTNTKRAELESGTRAAKTRNKHQALAPISRTSGAKLSAKMQERCSHRPASVLHTAPAQYGITLLQAVRVAQIGPVAEPTFFLFLFGNHQFVFDEITNSQGSAISSKMSIQER